MTDPLFTIVIPYHTHPKTIDFLKRQLNYYHFNPTNHKIIIAVSGEEKLKAEIEKYIKDVKDPRFAFWATDEKDITNIRSYVKKIRDALKLVKTPYVVINGADDVLLPEEVKKGTKILEQNLDIAAIKGHTIYYNYHSGSLFFSKDLEISQNNALDRLKLAIKDRDSIFYIIRRTKDLVQEYENIVTLSVKSEIVGNSLYHIEYFQSLSVAALGKVCVFNSPWRIQTSHENNHTSHTPASFMRFKLGALDKHNYEWFKSVTKNMEILSYQRYKILWVFNQIRGISLTFKQVAYQFLHKKCSFIDFLRISTYIFFNKIYIFSQKILPEKWFGERLKVYGSAVDFIKTDYYQVLKRHYFTENNVNLLESK